jgi:hypothetical protein
MNFFEEQPLPIIETAPRILRYRTRRDILLLSAGAAAALKFRGKEWLLNKALRLDDDVAEALYSGNRMVPTYSKSQITPLKNNYNGATPDPGYISGWSLTLDGLASSLRISLDIRNLMTRFTVHE